MPLTKTRQAVWPSTVPKVSAPRIIVFSLLNSPARPYRCRRFACTLTSAGTHGSRRNVDRLLLRSDKGTSTPYLPPVRLAHQNMTFHDMPGVRRLRPFAEGSGGGRGRPGNRNPRRPPHPASGSDRSSTWPARQCRGDLGGSVVSSVRGGVRVDGAAERERQGVETGCLPALSEPELKLFGTGRLAASHDRT